MKFRNKKTIYLILVIIFIVLSLLIFTIIFFRNNKLKNIKFKLLFYDDYKEYLPVFLYISQFQYILHDKFNLQSEIIKDINFDIDDSDICFICFSIHMNYELIEKIKKMKGKVIFIATEIYDGVLDRLLTDDDDMRDCTLAKCTIFEYSQSNIFKWKKDFPELLNVEYLPFLFDDYLIHFYELYKHKRIPWKDKENDILIFGNLSPRRENIFNNLKSKYNIKQIIRYSIEDAINEIENSKIILNVFREDFLTNIFDYFRISFLFSNKIFVICENLTNIDIDYEKNLIDYETELIMTDYHNIENLVDKYMKYDENEINKILDKQFKWFSRNKMETLYSDFFNNLYN